MQIIVLGAGAIGSLYGAKLAARNDVTLVARAEHADAINAHGLQIEGLEEQRVPLRATTRLEQIDPDALILLTTKVPDTAAALAPIAKMVRDDTTILSLQNGLGVERIVCSAVADRGVVLRGITRFGAIFDRPGTIRYMVRGATLIEEHERSARIAETLNAAGLACRVSQNIAADVWRKVIYNCVVNPITTLIGSKVGSIAEPRLDPWKRIVIDECIAVAAAEGVAFEKDLLREINAVFAGSPNTVSMLQDLRRGRTTEIDHLNGAVAALGEQHGIACGANAGLTSLIKALERGRASLLPEEMLEPQSI